ncbi:hypothetical protein Tco_0754322 [Tanacetum coccineum]
MIMILKDLTINGPSDAMHNPPSHSESLKRLMFHFLRRSTRFYQLSNSKIVDIEKEKPVINCQNIRVLLFRSIHSDDGNLLKKPHQQALVGDLQDLNESSLGSLDIDFGPIIMNWTTQSER